MSNTGIGFIVWPDGWACSDDVFIDKEHELIEVEGKKSLHETPILKFNYIFEGKSILTKGIETVCLFKTGEVIRVLKGKVKAKKESVTIEILGPMVVKENYIKQVIQKIKGGN